MRRFLPALLLLFAPLAFAQNQTIVTGTITDPSGIPYYPATVSACLTPATLYPMVAGQQVNNNPGTNYCFGPVSTASNGSFLMSLWGNALITCSPTCAATQWLFTVVIPGPIQPVGFGPQQFTATITISGSSQDIGATLNAAGVSQLRPAGTATNATNLVGPGSITGSFSGTHTETGNVTLQGNNIHSGAETFALLNGDYVTGSVTYPLTGAGLQAAITAAAGVGCVYAVRGTYTLSAPLTIPSNSCIYWDNATIASNGYNGDMLQSTSTSNVTFRGKLILNGSAMGTGTIGQGMNFTNVNNFSFDDIEGNGATNACIEMTGTSHVRGNKVYLQNCGKSGSTTASFFIGNNSTTPSTDFMIHEIEIDTPTGGAPEDCFYVSGTTATPSLRINVVSLILNGCTDSALEINFSQGVNIGKVVAQAVVNSAVLIRRGDTDVNIESIACSGATAYKICLDIANFQAGDPSEQRISVGQVTASNASSDVVNGAAVRISNSITTSSLTNISIGTLIADTSTRGFYCTAGTTHNAHISIGNLITHNNLGDGIKMLNCDDISGGSWISFDNKVGGTADNGNAINIQAGATGNIAAVNVFDDRGGSKLQPFGFFADGTTTNWFIGVFGCQDALEVTGCLSNSGTGNQFIRKKDATDRIKVEAATTEFSGFVQSNGLSTFANNFFNGFTTTGMGTITPNTAASADVGTTALPWGNLWLGTAATSNFKFQPATTAGARIWVIPDWGANGASTQNQPFVITLTSQYTNSTTTFSNVAGGNTIQFAVAANSNYTATCHLYYQAAATGGLNIEFTGPASPTAVRYGMDLPTAITGVASGEADAFGTSIGAVSTAGAVNLDAMVSFSLLNGANAGTVNLLAKSSAAVQLQIQSGSWCRIQ